MIVTLFFFATMLALFGLGVFIVVGTAKGVPPFVNTDESRWVIYYPLWFLRGFFGERHIRRAIYCYHLFIGILFIVAAIAIPLSLCLR